MWRQVKNSLVVLCILTAVTGLAYPLAITGLAQLLFPLQANGSLLYKDGQIIGSQLIGQNFADAGNFHGRPSAAGQDGYDAAGSAGSNLGPTNAKLLSAVQENLDKVRADNELNREVTVPADLVTASASGLDPDISPAAAYLQADRVAKARGLSREQVYTAVGRHSKAKQLGIFGEPRVNVLELNLELANLQP